MTPRRLGGLLAGASGAVSGALIVAMMALVVADILGRWLVNKPLEGSFELVQVCLMGSVFMGFPYAEWHGDHIKVDLLYERLPKRGRLVVDLLAGLAQAAVVGVLAWQMWVHRAHIAETGRTTTALGLPQGEILWLAVAGSTLFVVVTVLGHLERGSRDGSIDSTIGGI